MQLYIHTLITDKTSYAAIITLKWFRLTCSSLSVHVCRCDTECEWHC